MKTGPGRIDRLTPTDLTNLAVEAADTPMHVGVVLVVDGRTLCGPDGTVPTAAARSMVERRLGRVPLLRQRLYRPSPLAGRPLWIDDADFRIDRHVDTARVAPPGDDPSLLALVETLLAPPMDRRRPLWRIWFVGGLPGRRVAVVVALHHAVADGTAMVRMLSALLDGAGEPVVLDGAGEPVAASWRPRRPPAYTDLVAQNVRSRLDGLARFIRGARHWRPGPLPRQVFGVVREAWGAPRTSVNGPIGPRRASAVFRFDLAIGRAVAHAHGGTVNDVVLDLAAGGLRALLRSRGEPVARMSLRAAVPVSRRNPGQMSEAGNRSGVIVVRLPLADPDPRSRLTSIALASARAKVGQRASAEPGLLVWLARTGLLRFTTRRQRLTNVVVSNVVGPPEPITVLGAPLLDLIPLGALGGNLAVSFLALSYAGRVSVTVRVDADQCPDPGLIVDAMARDWETLAAR